MNPWITHVKAYHAAHPNLSYKQAISGAKPTYKKRIRGGGGVDPVSAVAGAVGQASNALGSIVGNVTDVGNNTIAFVAKNKGANGAYTAKLDNRRQAAYAAHKRQMKTGKFPQMSDNALWNYVYREIKI